MANYNSSHAGQTIDNAVTLVTGNKTKNYVLAAPESANGAALFRALTIADIPDLSSLYGNVVLASTYDENTKTVTLTVGSLGDADSTEY